MDGGVWVEEEEDSWSEETGLFHLWALVIIAHWSLKLKNGIVLIEQGDDGGDGGRFMYPGHSVESLPFTKQI